MLAIVFTHQWLVGGTLFVRRHSTLGVLAYEVSLGWYGGGGTEAAGLGRMKGWRVDSTAYAEGYGPRRVRFDQVPRVYRTGANWTVVLPNWVLLLPAAATACWSFNAAWKVRRLRLAGRCARCGYALQGLPPARPCPECGAVPAPGERRVAAMWPAFMRGMMFIGLLLTLLGGAGWIALSGLHPTANADSFAAFQIGPDRCGLAWLPERLWYPVSEESNAAAMFAQSELPSRSESIGWMREDRDRSWAIELRLWWVVIFGCVAASVGWAVARRRGTSESHDAAG